MEIKTSDIFKYCPYDIGELIISGQILKFSSPDSFNDPFDCDINLLEFNFSECSQEIKNELELIKKDISKQRDRDMSKEVDKIPLDKIEDIYRRSQLDKINRSSICCFSKNYKNTTMWSHYADNHKGVCLIFDISHENPLIDHRADRLTQGPVDYDNYTPANYLKSKLEGIMKLYLTKSSDWRYEEEFRITIIEESGLFKFHQDFLRGVIFGLRVTDKEIEQFKLICKSHRFNNLVFGRFKKNKLDLKLEDI